MAAKDKPLSKLYFVVIDEYRNVPDEITGELKLQLKTPAYRDQIVYVNRLPAVVDGIPRAAECKKLVPDSNGIYVIDQVTDSDWSQAVTVMQAVMKTGAPVFGPFDDMQKAIIAKQELRKKTPIEEAQTLKAAMESKDTEINALKAEIEKLQSAAR